MKSNKLFIENLRKDINQRLDYLEQQLEQSQVTLKEMNLNELELVVKVTDEDNPYLKDKDMESDNNGNEYFISLILNEL